MGTYGTATSRLFAQLGAEVTTSALTDRDGNELIPARTQFRSQKVGAPLVAILMVCAALDLENPGRAFSPESVARYCGHSLDSTRRKMGQLCRLKWLHRVSTKPTLYELDF